MAHTKFSPPTSFYNLQENRYQLLPFRFDRWREDRYFLSNEAGEFLFLEPKQLQLLVDHKLDPTNPVYPSLKAKHFLIDDQSSANIDLLAAKYRTKKSFGERKAKLPSQNSHCFTSTRPQQGIGFIARIF